MTFEELVARVAENKEPVGIADELFEAAETRSGTELYLGFRLVHYIVANKATNYYKYIPKYSAQKTASQTIIRLFNKQKFVLEQGSSPLHVAIVFDNLTATNALIGVSLQRNIYLESALHVSCYFSNKAASLMQNNTICKYPLELCYAEANSYNTIQLMCLYGRQAALSRLLLEMRHWLDCGQNMQELHQLGRQCFALNEAFLDLQQLCLRPIEYSTFGTSREEKMQAKTIVEEIQSLFLVNAELLDVQEYINYYLINKRSLYSEQRSPSAGEAFRGASFYI